MCPSWLVVVTRHRNLWNDRTASAPYAMLAFAPSVFAILAWSLACTAAFLAASPHLLVVASGKREGSRGQSGKDRVAARDRGRRREDESDGDERVQH